MSAAKAAGETPTLPEAARNVRIFKKIKNCGKSCILQILCVLLQFERTKKENMYNLDFLIMNEDRPLNNFGIIRDVNTLKWLDVAPIFDNGQSLNIEYYDEEELHISGEGKLFYEVKPFDELIKIVKDIKKIDVSKLEGLPEWFDDLLHQYQHLTGYSGTRINRLCILLNRQINKLKKLVENS